MNSKCVCVWVQRWFLQQWLNAGMLKGRWDNRCLYGKIAKRTDYWCNVGRQTLLQPCGDRVKWAWFWRDSSYQRQNFVFSGRLESRQRWSRSISDQWLWSCRWGCLNFLHLGSEKVSKIARRQLGWCSVLRRLEQAVDTLPEIPWILACIDSIWPERCELCLKHTPLIVELFAPQRQSFNRTQSTIFPF